MLLLMADLDELDALQDLFELREACDDLVEEVFGCTFAPFLHQLVELGPVHVFRGLQHFV